MHIKNKINKDFALKSVTLSNAVKHLGNGAFGADSKMSSFKFSNILENIGNYCFSMCTSLRDVVLPKSLKNVTEGGKTTYALGDGIFNSCSAELKYVSYEGTCAEFGAIYRKATFSNSSISTVKCSDGIFEII